MSHPIMAFLWTAVGILAGFGVFYAFCWMVANAPEHHTRRELLEEDHNNASYAEQRQEIEKLYSIWNLTPGTPEYAQGWRELRAMEEKNKKAWEARVKKILDA